MRTRRDVVLRRLIAARDLLSNKENWTVGRFAADADGRTVDDASSPQAAKFCAVGAIRRVTFADAKRRGESTFTGGDYAELVKERVEAELPQGFSSIIGLNDTGGGHARRRVVATFNRAIKTLEAELA
jgi:hypothetical protein